MDRETWLKLSNEVEPILKKLRQIATNYKLDGSLSLAAFNDGYVWADYIDRKDDEEKPICYEALLRDTGSYEISEGYETYIRS